MNQRKIQEMEEPLQKKLKQSSLQADLVYLDDNRIAVKSGHEIQETKGTAAEFCPRISFWNRKMCPIKQDANQMNPMSVMYSDGMLTMPGG